MDENASHKKARIVCAHIQDAKGNEFPILLGAQIPGGPYKGFIVDDITVYETDNDLVVYLKHPVNGHLVLNVYPHHRVLMLDVSPAEFLESWHDLLAQYEEIEKGEE